VSWLEAEIIPLCEPSPTQPDLRFFPSYLNHDELWKLFAETKQSLNLPVLSKSAMVRLLADKYAKYSFSRNTQLARCDTCTKFEILSLKRVVSTLIIIIIHSVSH